MNQCLINLCIKFGGGLKHSWYGCSKKHSWYGSWFQIADRITDAVAIVKTACTFLPIIEFRVVDSMIIGYGKHIDLTTHKLDEKYL
jgi:hypothetical protein